MGYYDSHIDRGIEFYEANNLEAAKAAFERALEGSCPKGDVRAKCWLARLSMEAGVFEDAIPVLESALKDNPEDSEVNARLALSLVNIHKDAERCAKLAQKSVELDADNGMGYIALWKVFGIQNAYHEALDALKKGLRRGATYSTSEAFEIIQNWAQLYCDEAEYQKAYELTQSVVDYFNSFDFIILHARLADYANKPREAVIYYKKALGVVRPGQLRNEILESIAAIAM